MATKKPIEYLPNPGGAPLVLLHYKDLLNDSGVLFFFSCK
jgi:hypothetical protein